MFFMIDEINNYMKNTVKNMMFQLVRDLNHMNFLMKFIML
jgi:hypothetical protein